MDLTRLLRGKTVACVVTNGHVLSIRCTDNTELNVAWVDGNGIELMGRPVVHTRGGRLRAEGIRDLMHLQDLPRNLHTAQAQPRKPKWN